MKKIDINNKKIFDKLNEILFKRRQSLYLQIYPVNLDKADVSVIDKELKAFVERHDFMFSIKRINLVTTLNIKLAQLGYTIHPQDSNILIDTYTSSDINSQFKSYINTVNKFVGNDKTYIPMYPGFPEQVINMDESELEVNAFLHYLTNGKFFANEDERMNYAVNRPETDVMDIIEEIPFKKKIDIITNDEEICEIFYNLMSAPTSLSADDKEDIEFFLNNLYEPEDGPLPEISFKENAMFVVANLLKTTTDINTFSNNIKTATDVLRLYTALSDGDVSLASPTRFKNLPNRYYRFMLNCLNDMAEKNLKQVISDMFMYDEEWKRIGEKLHPGREGHQYDSIKKAFAAVRNGNKPVSWMGYIQRCLADNEIENAADKLIERPGVFARSLDELLRKSIDDKEITKKIMSMFMSIAQGLTIPMLMQIVEHFRDRNDLDERSFMPKGEIAKTFVIDNKLEPIPEYVCESICNICETAMKSKMLKKDYLGSVYIDPSFDGYVVPYSQRSASASNRPCVRGSRWSLKPNTNVIRTFIWWTNYIKPRAYGTEEVRVDEDLSVLFVSSLNPSKDVKFKYDICNYTNLRRWNNNPAHTISVHSGDIIDGGRPDGFGATEFVDIDISEAFEAGFKYVILSCKTFSGQTFDMYNSRAGFMELGTSIIGPTDKVFIPEKVELNVDINSSLRC